VTSTVTATTTTTFSAPAEPLRALCFSPDGGCANVLIAWLEQARVSIHVMVYVFTSDAIANALIEAHQRGVEVLVVVERSEAATSGSEVARLQDAGIQVRLDANAALMHHKVAIVDQAIVATGSYNWSAAAEERNNENLVVLADTNVAAQYEAAFSRIWDAAVA
jgi:phosphatidylserine/phosphatidylglycerophosphate/cardiolipin synthase-like enzyme